MKKLFLIIGVVVLLASCTNPGANTIVIQDIDSTEVIVDSVLNSLDSTNVITVEQDSID